MRGLPAVALSVVPERYARLAAQGWDTVQEALALQPTPAFVEALDGWQRAARDIGNDLEGVVTVNLGGEPMKACATGAKGGFRWRLENDDFLIFIGSPKRDWTISIRYLSAGLWEHGLEALRARVFEALRPYTRQMDDDCVRVSRADWCFDFYSPAFTDEFRPELASNVVCHSSAKVHSAFNVQLWSHGAEGQTITIGSKAGLQVQVYDKTREITEASGKTWLYPVWVDGLGENPWDDRPSDMWRLECRFAGDFLKERNVRRPHELIATLPNLIAETLFTRRLTLPTSDSNRWRWPLHPLWSAAYAARGAGEMLALGRKVTGRREALVDQARRQIAGAVRSATALAKGGYSDDDAKALTRSALNIITEDKKHHRKVAAALDRYSDVEDAK